MKQFLERLIERRIRAYQEEPGLLGEHYAIEQTVLAGGYGYRQIVELVQNGADAILEARQEFGAPQDGSRIHVLLTGGNLYVANTGAALSTDGLDALLRSHSSPKRGNQIGRFGLGFKSLLRLGGRIDIFTRASGAIRFDPLRCLEELRKRFGVAEAPRLRLAWTLEDVERSRDEVLASLRWAETIVRAEVPGSELQDYLRKEIRTFPTEFLLFFRVPVELKLEDGKETARTIKLVQEEDQHVLHDGAHASRWRMVRREVALNDSRALADATHIHARDRVPLDWAVPVEGRREEVGRFWAFFPTQTPTYLPGILNAPWKLNSDRNALIAGEWNSALMVEAARLVAEVLPELATSDDPGRPIDAFPRQMDRKDEDAAPLVDALWPLVASTPVVADATGGLCIADRLCRHPRDSRELARVWHSLASAEEQAKYVHPACLDRQRSSRLNALADRLANAGAAAGGTMLRRPEVADWFGEVASKDVSTAIAVLRLAEAFKNDCKPAEWDAVREELAIIPTEDGSLVAARQALIAPAGTKVPGRSTVAAGLCDDTDARRILVDVLRVRTPDNKVWSQVLAEALMTACASSYESIRANKAWQDFWAAARQAPEPVRGEFFRTRRGEIRIQRRDGAWVDAENVLLPGRLISADDASDNSNLLVNDAMHSRDLPALTLLGVVDMPEGGYSLRSWIDLSQWLSACRSYYKEACKNSASWDYLEPNYLWMPRGFNLLSCLKGASNTLLTQHLLQCANADITNSVDFGHRTSRTYPTVSVPHPLLWVIAQSGTAQIGDECVRVACLMARRRESALEMLSDWDEYEKALEVLDNAFPKVVPTKEDIATLWRAMIVALVTQETLGSEALSELWTAAAHDGVIPETLPAIQGAVPISKIYVTSSPDLAARARRRDRVVITLDETTLTEWIRQGARDLAKLIEPRWSRATGPVAQLVEAMPELTAVLRAECRRNAGCQPVTGLELKFEETTEPVACLMWQGNILVDLEALGRHSRSQRLELLVREVAPAGWLDCSPEDALVRLGRANVDDRRAKVARGETMAQRLLLAAGNRKEPLLEALGGLKDSTFVKRCTTLQLAELVLAQSGPAVLSDLRKTLSDEGLNPPERWNTPDARAFVVSIGFPLEFATAPASKREAEEFVSGPIELPPLHDFQEDVMVGLEALLASTGKRRRAVVSLPTGGGKTRVMVEAAVRLVLAPAGTRRSVIWIAQTDELCEQAVQAFRQVWVNVGAKRTDLRIIRLWGGHPNPTIEDADQPVAVVASIQTLNSRMGTQGLVWLRKPGLVVVDECHHAITPSYSNLLRWLDADAPRTSVADSKDEPPIVGLSATPFRSDDDESRRLARRFDNRWFPSDQQALHTRLMDQGILARAEYEALQSGAGLSKEELRLLGELPDQWEGLEFDRLLESINQRLAGDEQRTQRLVAFIRRCPEKSVIVFANSVLHAEEMSARLNLIGIAASAVSANTPVAARRYFLERFQRGEIQVLCNHSVLGTGFDAPKTEMIMIARQVFSPVRYMQMVGRGLRGERNGGTVRCRIVTVLDNLGRFEDRHPYHYCQQYYSGS